MYRRPVTGVGMASAVAFVAYEALATINGTGGNTYGITEVDNTKEQQCHSTTANYGLYSTDL